MLNAGSTIFNQVGENGLSNCFYVFHTELYVSLAPIHLNNPINGIKAQHLDPLVMSYFPRARGVVLSYLNIKLDRQNESVNANGENVTIARIEGSTPFTFMWVLVDLLVWRPLVGDVMEGYVYMQTASHIGLLVHDTFNASIKKLSIPHQWEFVPSQEDEIVDEFALLAKSFGYWADENGNRIDGKLKFIVKRVHLASKVLSLEGTLLEPGLEQESQPVLHKAHARGNDSQASSTGKHLKFDEDDTEDSTGVNSDQHKIAVDGDEEMPAYEQESEEDVEEEEERAENSDASD